MRTGIKVFAPASVANVGVGFDILGFALNEPGDEIVARFTDKPGLSINKITGAKGKLPYEIEKNTAGVAAQSLLDHIGYKGEGISLEIRKKMPFSSGLGSSAASAVAGAMAVNELLKRPFEKRNLLHFAALGEAIASGSYHLDNVAPSLLGGMILIRDTKSLDVHRIHTPRGLHVVVVYPEISINTKDARNLLKETISLNQHIQQSGNLAGFITGLFTSNIDLIKRSLQDVIIEDQRAPLIPHFKEIQSAAINNGALGCTISGAGPSIFALCQSTFIAKNVEDAMSKIYTNAKINFKIYSTPINNEGAIKF